MSNKNNILLKIKNRNNKAIVYTKMKKHGFTLIEIIAVIAIIGIISAAIIPRVNGYIKEAKKVRVLDQSRKVIMAVESYNLKADKPLTKDLSVQRAISNDSVKKYVDENDLVNLDVNKTSLQDCYDILSGAEFEILDDNDILDSSKIAKKSK